MIEHEGEILHVLYTSDDIPENSRCLLELDWQRRFDSMQRHTGEHIFTGVFDKLFGGTNRGFQCGTRGIAASINIDTLQYTNWELHGKSLILKGKRFANRHVFDIADTLPIRKINASTMVIASGNSTHTYHKIR